MTNVDKLKLFPDQNADHRYTECVGVARADVIGNLFQIPMDPDFSYASDLYLQRATPTNAGEEVYPGLAADFIYGALPDSSDTSDPLQTSELVEANFSNYTHEQKQLAAHFKMTGGIKELHSFEEIKDFIDRYQRGVLITFTWASSFETLNADATMPMPSGASTVHETVSYGYDNRGLLLKSWQGPNRGEGGYEFCSKQVLQASALSAYAYDPTAWTWLSLVKIALQFNRAIPDILPILYAANHS